MSQVSIVDRFTYQPFGTDKVRATARLLPADNLTSRKAVAAKLGMAADDLRAAIGPGQAVFDVAPVAGKEQEFADAVKKAWP